MKVFFRFEGYEDINLLSLARRTMDLLGINIRHTCHLKTSRCRNSTKAVEKTLVRKFTMSHHKFDQFKRNRNLRVSYFLLIHDMHNT
jgi:hypothetical protein